MLRRDSELRRHEPLNESHGIVEGSRAFPAPQTLRTVRLYHRQVYACAFHRPKLELLYAGALDDKRRGETRSRRLPTFSNASRLIVPTSCSLGKETVASRFRFGWRSGISVRIRRRPQADWIIRVANA